MERYRDLKGNSAVAAYELAPGSITIEFKSGSTYVYDEASTGAENLRRMRLMATQGWGLSRFINTVVGDRYARRLR